MSLNRSRVKEVFSEAAELNPAERATYLERVCAGDRELRTEVEKLLDALDSATRDVLGRSSVGEFLFEDRQQTLALGTLVARRFRIQRLIGRGGMGEVYAADDLEFGGTLALKTLRSDLVKRPDVLARFRREIQLARKVTHPNVCRIFDVGFHPLQDGEVAFLTMDLLTGETLAERLKRNMLHIEDALYVLRQIASGLNALHQAQVVHRDLKPANIILTRTSTGLRAVITDFGLAHPVVAETIADSVTVPGEVVGTCSYMAPEQLTGKPVGPPADIYALGIVMYQILCGRRPFEADSFAEIAALKLTQDPEPPERFRTLSQGWNSLILRCLKRDPADRPETTQVLALLEEINGRSRSTTDETVELSATTVTIPAQPAERDYHRWITWLIDQVRAKPWLRASIIVAAAALITAGVSLRMPSLRTSVMGGLCEQFPASALWCELPADKDLAVFPFRIAGASEDDKALAAGLARYVRESFARLAPEPERLCVHLRDDQVAEGVGLVLQGAVEANGNSVLFDFTISQSAAAGGSAKPRILRRGSYLAARSSSRQLHASPLVELARALELQYPEKEWQGWLQSGPNNDAAFGEYLKGLGWLNQNRYEEAVKAFQTVTDPVGDFMFAPGHVGLADAYRLLGNKTGEQGSWIRARQAYQRAIPLDRYYGFANAERGWGELEIGTGDRAQGISHLEAALALSPYDHFLRKLLATTYEGAGRIDDAERVLREGVQRTPECWLAHNALASFYSQHARFRQAETSFLEVLRLAPNNATGYHNLAFDYLKVGRFDEAVGLVVKSIELKPRALWYSTLGRAFLYKGCHADALVNLRKAVEMEPDYFAVWVNLSEGLYETERNSDSSAKVFEETVDVCKRVLQTNPARAYVRSQLALNSARLKKTEEALDQAARAIASAPQNHDVALAAAETMETAGDRAGALKVLKNAFAEGLSIFEAQSNYGLRGLRQDRRYQTMLTSLGLDAGADPGGLSSERQQGCPEWGVPGKGWKN